METFFTYVASFSDGVQKIGVTAQPFYRLQDFLLEAARHKLELNGFWLSEPSETRQIAIESIRATSNCFGDQKIPGHHTWFRYAQPHDSAFLSGVLPDRFFDISSELRAQQSARNTIAFALHVGSTYHDFCQFADELATNGQAISATAATRLAAELIRPHGKIFAEATLIASKSEHLLDADGEEMWRAYFERKEEVSRARCEMVVA